MNNIETDLVIAELSSTVEALWALRDDPERAVVPLQTVLRAQEQADHALAWWADQHGIACRTPEEKADALAELRLRNAERLGLRK